MSNVSKRQAQLYNKIMSELLKEIERITEKTLIKFQDEILQLAEEEKETAE